MLSLSKLLKKCTETGFEITLKEGNVWRCFSRVLPCCGDIIEAEGMSSVRHGAGSYHSCVRCTINIENMVHVKKRPSRMLAATAETRRQVHSLKKIAEIVSKRRPRQRRREKLG